MIIGATSAERFNNESRPLFLFFYFLMNDIFGGVAEGGGWCAPRPEQSDRQLP